MVNRFRTYLYLHGAVVGFFATPFPHYQKGRGYDKRDHSKS